MEIESRPESRNEWRINLIGDKIYRNIDENYTLLSWQK